MRMAALTLGLMALLAGCATWKRTFVARDLLNVNPGMNKADVVHVLNDPQSVVVAQQIERGFLEAYEYVEKPVWFGRVNSNYWTSYIVYFLDGKLVGWKRDEVTNAQRSQNRTLETIAAFNAWTPVEHKVDMTIRQR